MEGIALADDALQIGPEFFVLAMLSVPQLKVAKRGFGLGEQLSKILGDAAGDADCGC